MPDKASSNLLQKIIDDNVKKYGGFSFKPHMSLYGGFETEDNSITKKIEQLSLQLNPFTAITTEVAMSTTFYQCVFVRIKTIPQVMNAHLKAKKTLGISDHHVYMPHISLVYGDLNLETKQKIIDEIKLSQVDLVFESIKLVGISKIKEDPSYSETLAEFGLKKI